VAFTYDGQKNHESNVGKFSTRRKKTLWGLREKPGRRGGRLLKAQQKSASSRNVERKGTRMGQTGLNHLKSGGPRNGGKKESASHVPDLGT